MMFLATLTSIFAASAGALTLHHGGREAKTNNTISKGDPITFQSFYEGHTKGRGIWKWDNALDEYQRLFSPLIGKPVAVAEVGVQSGGSLLMWQTVLGQQSKMYGLDINPACSKFKGGNVDITIGDQGDWQMWQNFFVKVSTGLDILVDDGSHEARHMLTTLFAAFPHIKPGGYIAIEDIHGAHYLDSFFKPAATFLAQRAVIGSVQSVHLYPALMVVRKGGAPPADTLQFTGAKVTVADFTAMWTAINTAAPGSQVVLRNPAWTDLFSAEALSNFFGAFIDLHAGGFKDTPKGCSTTKAAVCTNEISPMSYVQQRVRGVHIYKDHAVIEVPAKLPRVAAVRKGTEWIGYGF